MKRIRIRLGDVVNSGNQHCACNATVIQFVQRWGGNISRDVNRARGLANQKDPLRITAVWSDVGSKPAYRQSYVIRARRPGMGRGESVRHGDAHEAGLDGESTHVVVER